MGLGGHDSPLVPTEQQDRAQAWEEGRSAYSVLPCHRHGHMLSFLGMPTKLGLDILLQNRSPQKGPLVPTAVNAESALFLFMETSVGAVGW